MKKKAFYGWKLLAAFWFIYLVNLGFPTYGQSVINAYMAKDLHWIAPCWAWRFRSTC